VVVMLMFSVLLLSFLFWQIFRNNKVYKIRALWIATNDDRWYLYSFGEMTNPNKYNKFGIKYPKDKDFRYKKE